MRFIAKTLIVFAFLSSAPALAEEEPPTRVGRVSFISGTLAFYQSGETDWSAAKVNLPAATGGWFATDPQSRAEIRIGPDTIDIAEDSELNITDLRDRAMQLGIEHGRFNLHLRELGERASAEIDVPRGGVWLLQPGIYDIETGAADSPTRITAFDGSVRFVGGGVDVTIKAGDTLMLSGRDTLSAAVERAVPDAFAKWCRSRDYNENRLASPHRVSPAMTGFEELDAYGSWNTVPDYGTVWYPNSLPAEWAPYRDGHWVWIEPWGWNWVDAEPWGFAPCHYGRWTRINDRWGWVPGNFVPQPVYAPALVAFIAAPGIAAPAPVDIGPAVGWFPLAPGEVYWPSYTRNPTYIENVNIANVSATKITNITKIVAAERSADPPPQVASQQFVNRSAATVVPMRVMAASTAVAPAALTVRPQALQQASISVRPPQVRPATAGPIRPAAPAPTPNAAAPHAQAAHVPPTQETAPVPGHRPAPPNFSQLAPAPGGGRAPAAPAQQPAQTTPAAPAPNSQQPSPVAQRPAPAMPAAPAPSHPPSPPNFSHLAPATAAHEKPPVTPPPARAAQGMPSPPGAPVPSRSAGQAVQATQGAPRAPASVPPPSVGQEPPPQTIRPPQAAEQERQRAAQQQQAQQRATQQQAQQRAAQQQQAQQRAAQQQQAQQRAAQQQAQQRAAQQQQAQQRAAQQQQAQQRAAQQQAQQRATQQQAQQRAAQQQQAQQQAAAQQQAQQRAAQQHATAAKQQAEAPAACGHPGQQACPR